MGITVKQAIDVFSRCNPDAELRIYFPKEDFSDAVVSIEEDIDDVSVYFYGFYFPNNGQDIHNRTSVRVIMHKEGYFRQVQESFTDVEGDDSTQSSKKSP